MSAGNDTPVACALPEPARRRRRDALRRGLLARVRETREIPDGLAFRLPADAESEAQARAFVAFERTCCGFARYAIRRDGDALWIEITGPDGTRAFVRRWLGDDEAPASRGGPREEDGW